MGMSGVEDLVALQWIAELIALGVGIFFATCFMIGFMAGPDKIESKSIIPETIELGYISEPKTTARKTNTSNTNQEVQRLKLEIQKLKLEKQLVAKQPAISKRMNQKYNGTGWDAVDVAGNTGDDWNPPEYYEAKKTKKTKETKVVTPDQGVMQDCKDALVSLGEKKPQANRIVKDYFEKYPKTKSVDEFIAGVYSK